MSFIVVLLCVSVLHSLHSLFALSEHVARTINSSEVTEIKRRKKKKCASHSSRYAVPRVDRELLEYWPQTKCDCDQCALLERQPQFENRRRQILKQFKQSTFEERVNQLETVRIKSLRIGTLDRNCNTPCDSSDFFEDDVCGLNVVDSLANRIQTRSVLRTAMIVKLIMHSSTLAFQTKSNMIEHTMTHKQQVSADE